MGKNRGWNAKELLVDWRSSWADHVNHTLERLQAAREGHGEDRSAKIERNVESAGQELTEQDRDRERTLKRERERSIAREGPPHSR